MRASPSAPTAPTPSYTEAVMEAWKNKTWAWDIEGISLHSYTVVKWPPAFKATGFGEDEYADAAASHAAHGRPAAHAQRDHGQVRSGEEDRAGGGRVGRVAGDDAGHPEGFLEQQNSQRDAHHRRAEHQHFRAPRRSRARRQHRADGQRAAGDDLHATRKRCC